MGLGLLLSLYESDVVKNISHLYMGGAQRIGNAQGMVQAQGPGVPLSEEES